jgi:hypothetical protein
MGVLALHDEGTRFDPTAFERSHDVALWLEERPGLSLELLVKTSDKTGQAGSTASRTSSARWLRSPRREPGERE